MSITSPVHNRGVAPSSFTNALARWAANAPEEIFSLNYKSSHEPDIYSKFSMWRVQNPTHDYFPIMRDEHSLYRRALMCEVLRVLAGFESSWRQTEGRDVTNPSSNTAATEEAGWFQCSANSVNFHSSLKDLFNEWADLGGDPHWKDMHKSGPLFIEMTKGSPVYAIEHCARLLRFTIRHHGPLVRGEVFQWMRGDAVREFMDLIETANPSLSVEVPDEPAPKPQPNTTTSMSKLYIIDPGHGGKDPGAMSYGTKESDVVLSVSKKLVAYMARDVRFPRPLLTRGTDTYLDLNQRAVMANNADAILISIHANASNGKGTGFECFTSPGQTESDKLATELLEAYHEEMGDKLPGRYDTRDGDPDKEAKFTVLTATTGTAVLFELAFIDHPGDRQLLVSDAMQDRMAHALYVGICGYEGLVPLDLLVKPVAPPLAPLPIPVTVTGPDPLPNDPNPLDPTHFEVCAKWLAEGAEDLKGEIIESLKEKGDPNLFGWSDFEQIGFFEHASEVLLGRAASLKAQRKNG